MNALESAMAQEIAQLALKFQTEKTGHAPDSATVVLSNDTLVITLHNALTPAEQALAVHAEGAAQVREYHQQLFLTSADSLRKEIKRITGRDVREAAAKVEPASGTVVHAFTTGNVVQVYDLGNQQNFSASPNTTNPI
jgi:uncharacterized protein YbcI